jgi:hypothetical protein
MAKLIACGAGLNRQLGCAIHLKFDAQHLPDPEAQRQPTDFQASLSHCPLSQVCQISAQLQRKSDSRKRCQIIFGIIDQLLSLINVAANGRSKP